MSAADDAKTFEAVSAKLLALVGDDKKGPVYLSLVNGGLPQTAESMKWLTMSEDDLNADQTALQNAQAFADVANSIPLYSGRWTMGLAKMDSAFKSYLDDALYPMTELPPQYAAALTKAKQIVTAEETNYRACKTAYMTAYANLADLKSAKPASSRKDIIAAQNALQDARDAWDGKGNKAEYEGALATKVQLSSLGYPTAYKAMRDNFQAVKTAYNFAHTFVTPVDFFDSATAWTKASFSSSNTKASSSSDSKSWGGGLSAGWGLWSVGASTSGKQSSSTSSKDQEDVTVEFEYCRTPIIRRWFDPTQLIGRNWWSAGATVDKPLAGQISDGKGNGSWPLVVTEILWTRNLVLTFNGAHEVDKTTASEISGGGSVGWGPFSVNASYSQAHSSSESTAQVTGNKITSSATSIAGFICQLLPLEPNPLPELLQKQAQPNANALSDVTPGSQAEAEQEAKTQALPDADELHERLDGWMDGLAQKAKAKALELAKQAAKAAADKAYKAVTDKLKGQQAQAEQQADLYTGYVRLRSFWKRIPDILKGACFDVPLTADEAVQGALIAHRVQASNLDKALQSASSDNGASTSALSIALVTGKMWKTGQTIRVRFLDGDPAIQRKVAEKASIWERYANIHFAFGSDPAAEIRITFTQPGSWSLIGTDCMLPSYQGKATMNFGWFKASTPDAEYERTVVHEFGHALGAIHEHQNPRGAISWKVPEALYFYKTTQNWTDAQVQTNIFRKYDLASLRASQYDRDSIMHYPIDASLVSNPNDAVQINRQLSKTDKDWIAQCYPRVDPKRAAGFDEDPNAEARLSLLHTLHNTRIAQPAAQPSADQDKDPSARKSSPAGRSGHSTDGGKEWEETKENDDDASNQTGNGYSTAAANSLSSIFG